MFHGTYNAISLLLKFACVFSALIHDVDHRGVSNPLLCKEDEILAARYKSKSVAEQNSVDLAWSLFLEDQFQLLRETICASSDEWKRFRQIIGKSWCLSDVNSQSLPKTLSYICETLQVNVVLATDIFDKELSALRKNRWDKAFHQDERRRRGSIAVLSTVRQDTNRKATIVVRRQLRI